ncbi:hypothetical protein BKA82DRAFT_2014053 [Pisolithus tinctorius]|nr:hypothetical protein BKA82DRAFT_2014053 [Pisolithus tinctorius]
MYSCIRTTPDAVHAIGLIKSKAPYAPHAITLSVANRSAIASVNIPTNFPTDMPSFVLFTPITAEIKPGPCLTLLEASSTRAAVLTLELKGVVQILPGVNYTDM